MLTSCMKFFDTEAMKGLLFPLGLGEAFKFNHGISEFGVIRENRPETFGYSGNKKKLSFEIICDATISSVKDFYL